MAADNVRVHWEGAAPGWAQWEQTIAAWLAPATDAMLDMAGVKHGARVVLDVACGAGSQTLRAAERVGAGGRVVATDIAETMLRYVEANARSAGLPNVETLHGAAEDLELAPDSVDAVICRLGLMLFGQPARALGALRRALRPTAKIAVVVFTTPAANPFLAGSMWTLLRHAEKVLPPGAPGIFALGGPGVLNDLLRAAGFVDIDQRIVPVVLRMRSAADALTMMQDAFGAYRAVISDRPAAVQVAAWADVARELKAFEDATGFCAPAEVLVAAGAKPAASA